MKHFKTSTRTQGRGHSHPWFKKFLAVMLLGLFYIGGAQAQQANVLDFSGATDRIDCGNHSSLQITGNTITLEARIKINSFKPNVWEGGVIVKEGAGESGYMMRVGGSGIVNFNLGTGSSWKEVNTDANTVTTNTWYHIAATYDGTTQKIYVDGVLKKSTSAALNIANATNNLFLGDWYNSGDPRNIDAVFDEVRIWNIARTESQINDYKDVELTGSHTGLVAHYKFNQGIAGGNNATVTTLTDETGNNNGTLQNFALSGTSSNWMAEQATPKISYVTVNGAGSKDGSSWANASDDLQAMINGATAGYKIFVAKGTYKPNRPADNLTTIDANNRDNAFVLKSGVEIYGGFAGTEAAPADRDLSAAANKTTLSGDLGTAGTTATMPTT